MEDVDRIFALHVTSMLGETGDVLVNYGPHTSGTAMYRIKITGKGGHGGQPHKANNPIQAARELMNAISGILPEYVDPAEMAVLTVSYVNAGMPNALNVIPAEAELGGNLRFYKLEIRDRIIEKLRAAAEGICA